MLLCLPALLCAGRGQAQALPPSEGLIPDSTELRVLRQFYHATGGGVSTFWLPGSTLADAAQAGAVGVAGGDVVSLNLSARQLPGSLPAALSQLAQLQRLVLADNQFSGALPASWGQLTHLTFVDLGHNQLSDSLPASWGQLTQLTYLYLAANQLRGRLPAAWSQMAQLQTLNLSYNQFTGSLPAAWSQLAALQTLYLNQNQLSGSLPTTWEHFPQLTYFNAGQNQLSGPLPAEWGHFGSLQTLVLGDNQLNGALPASWGQLAHLTYVDLGHNQLSDSLPASWGQLSQLTYLYLAANQLRGRLPAAWGQLAQLQTLNLSYNQFVGPLPAAWGQLAALQTLYLNQNQFSGPLPEAWGHLAQLTSLNAEQNLLTGPLPDSLGQCSHLRGLYLHQNQITGPLPTGWGQLTQLQQLYLQSNALSGAIPASWGQLHSLTILELSYNQLSKSLPVELAQLTSLSYLGLLNNHLQGSLQPLVGMRSLTSVNAAGNRFSGELPTGLGQLVNLNYLYLDGNQLAGPVPAALGQLPHLYQLTLAGNHLSGTLPASVVRLPTLSYLQLAGNDLTAVEDLGGVTGLTLNSNLTSNYLDYVSLERLFTAPQQGRIGSLDVRGQRPSPRIDTLSYLAGESLVLRVPAAALGRYLYRYQWQRLVGSQWVNMPGDTLLTKTWAQATAAEQGTYRLAMHNRWFTDPSTGPTELYSAMVYTDLLPYKPLAQNKPDDTNPGSLVLAPADTASWRLAAGAAGDVNYVRSWSPRVALTEAGRVAAAPVDSVSTSTQYLDGLGRPVQTVLRQASPRRRDLVQPQAYDGLGREPRQYLPYPDSVQGRGGYRPQALAAQDAFYRRVGPGPGLQGPLDSLDVTRGVARTGAAYAATQFEDSPLNRVLAQGAAGEAWQLTSGHIQQRLERPNTETDSIPRFVPGYDPASLDPGYQGYYKAGELWGTEVADTHGPTEPGAKGYRTIEWKDKLGQVVLKQVEANRLGMSNTLRSRWLRTAYVYDDFSRLRFVLQPEATKVVLPLGQGPQSVPVAVQPFLFHYRYDARGRQIAKQVPGQDGETRVVFDQLDRPVLSQDAQQRRHQQWSWTKYDALGRIILSGLVTRLDSADQPRLQALATADTLESHQYEQRSASAAPHYYTTTHAFPQLGQGSFDAGQVLTVTYYDDYNFNSDAQQLADASYDARTDSQFPSGAAPVADALRTQGLTTRTKTRVLGVVETDDVTQPAAWLTTTTFYDERARPVQVQTTNARWGLDLLTTQLDFTGKVVQSVAVHQGPSHTPVTVAEFFRYDHTGRLLSTRQQLPGEAHAALLDTVSYNEIGQATRKTLGTGRLRQDVDYAYNIRGWLTSLNDPYQPAKEDLFNLSLHYERGFTKGYEQYNGNLTGQTWRGRDGVQRAYGYVYDPLNRLLQGDFVARTTTSLLTPSVGLWQAEEDNYRLSFVSYDDNGNIRTLRRRGLLQNATHAQAKQYGAVDNLTYTYQGNRLQAVDDLVTGNQLARPQTYHGAPTSLAGDFQEQGVKLAQEYLYDANGNLTQDKNKGITGIAYNHLNLPRQIHFGSVGDSLVFRYSAAGQKVAKLVYQTGKPMQRTDYLGPYQYEQDSLKFFPHAEGRVLRFVSYDNANQPTVKYQREFTFKDHLGNLRLAYRLGQTRTYLASLEQDAPTRKRETQQFDSLSVSQPIATATSYTYGGGTYAARLNASGGPAAQPLGPLTQLTVQKGDTLRVYAPGLYPQKVNNSSFAFSLASFVTSLLQPAPAGGPAGVDGSRRGGLPLLQIGLGAGLASLPQLSGGVPKGYLRVLVFNQDSALVDQRTLQLTQAALGSYQVLDTQWLPITQNGYVTVYVGNESPVDVYFDELRIVHRQGLQVQENQYDPYGLELAGISGAAPGLRLKNFYQFNGKENQLDLGLNWNHHDWRFFDYQLGRWHAVDPKVEDGQENWTPYAFGYDNAVRFNDPDGNCPTCITAAAGAVIGAMLGAGIEAGTQMYHNGGHVSDWHAVGGAAVQGGVTGGVAGLTGGTSLLAVGAAGAVSNVAGGAARNAYDGKPITVGSVAKDAAIGAVAGVGGHLAGKAIGAVASRLSRGAATEAEAGAGSAARGAKAPCGCFTAGTGISTRRGHKYIEQVQVGDSVWAYNERTRQTALRPVTHLFRHERDTVYVLHTATGEALRTTSDHPFYVRGQWVRVKRLRVGDSLVSQSGQRHVLRRIDLKPEHVTVYNFTVDELHTYFVGQNAILVHNSGPCPTGASAGGAFNPKSFADELVSINKTTEGGGALLNGNPSSVINSAMYYEKPAEQGAAIFRGISHGHMFVDGNKRTAVAAFRSFAAQNGLKTVSQAQMMKIATEVAKGTITDVSKIAGMLTR
ncbi:DUF6443 domain-containing protein [Hymenobacter ginkgonis]|uniref:DUF6443 domain-containing protein n=1 Tax=Hymenobacter ginkgonis TaxID=2682976 RepID=UPI0018DE672D|nr:polymorphic toxin-type HINT domain-containing protein [Hymenobacter ginkgonis]